MYTFQSNTQVLGIVAVAFILTYGIIVNHAFPYLGFAVAWSVLTTAIFVYKKHRDRFVQLAYLLSMLLSFCVFWRANPLLTFFNIVGAVGLTTVMAIAHDRDSVPGIVLMLFSPLVLFARAMGTKIEYANTMESDKLTQFFRKIKFQEAFVSIAVTTVLVLVIVPLLAGSNPFFKNLVDETVSFLNFSNFFERLFSIGVSNWTVLQLVSLGFLLLLVPRTFAYVATQVRSTNPQAVKEYALLLPKLVVAGILLIFFATQLQLYFASDAQLLAVGSTPSERTNEVFAQLSIVVGVIIGLLHVFRSYKSLEKKVTVLLLVEAAFLTLMAFSSVYQYAATYGFTFKRLWGLSVVFWLVPVLALFAKGYWQKLHGAYFAQVLLTSAAIALVIVNVVNFDYLIAHVHRPRTGEGTDYNYILQNVSHDGRADMFLLEYYEQRIAQSTEYDALSVEVFWKDKANWQVRRLQDKYQNLDLRGINLGEFVAYRSIQNYDVTADEQRNLARVLQFRPPEVETVEETPMPPIVTSPL